MKNLILPFALAAPLFFSAGGAPAQGQAPVPANQTWCLEAIDDSGLQPLLCRFVSEAQCNASRGSFADRCFLNPVIAFQQRRR